VFDRVRDNTKGIGSSGRLTYPQLINLSMNQTLARSINTSMVAIIPVLAILLIGAGFLGAQTLQSYGLALFVGLLSGAYSSIFIASPVLCMMKEREDRWVQIANRLAKRGDSKGWYSAVDAANLSTAMSVAASGQGQGGRAPAPPKARNKRSGPIRPGSGSAAAGGGSGAGTAVMDRPAGGSGAGGGAGSPGAGSPGATSTPAGGQRAGGSAAGAAAGAAAVAGSSSSASKAQPAAAGAGAGGQPRPRKGKRKRKR
jgi:preprotein translocase subunit SecF